MVSVALAMHCVASRGSRPHRLGSHVATVVPASPCASDVPVLPTRRDSSHDAWRNCCRRRCRPDCAARCCTRPTRPTPTCCGRCARWRGRAARAATGARRPGRRRGAAQARRRLRGVRARRRSRTRARRSASTASRSGEREVAVTEEVVARTPFGTLLHFRKDVADPPQPRVLIVAPMSGHFATLLRDTVRTMLRRPRRLHHRLAQRARRAARRRPLRPRRVRRAPDPVPRGDRARART